MITSRYHVVRIAIIASVVLLTMACTGDVKYTKAMLRAERMMENRPDSSLALLRGDSAQAACRGKATSMYHTLLKTLAEYKCFIPHTSDSVMLEVNSYYRFHGTPHQKLLSWYLLGSVYADMNLSADAIHCLKRGLDVNGIDERDVYVARSTNHIGHIYMYQGMFARALPYFLSSYRQAATARDSSVMTYALRDVARSYASRKMYRRAIAYFGKAMSLVKHFPRNAQLLNFISSEYAMAYLDMGDCQKAKSIFLSQKINRGEQQDGPYYNSGGFIYLANGERDSAIMYFEKCIRRDNLDSRIGASSALASLYHDLGDSERSYYYANKNQQWWDSLQQRTHRENANLIMSLNGKLQTEKENASLRMQLLIVLFVALLSVAATFLYLRHRRKVWKYKELLYKDAQLKMEISGNSYKEETERRIADLLAQIEEAKNADNEEREETLSLYMRKEENRLRQIHLLDERQTLLIEEFRKTALYEYFSAKADDAVTAHNKILDVKWKELADYLDDNFEHFAERLMSIYGVDGRNLHLCCLIRV